MTAHRAVGTKMCWCQSVVWCVRALHMDQLGCALGTRNWRKDRGGRFFSVRVCRGTSAIAAGGSCQCTRGRLLRRGKG